MRSNLIAALLLLVLAAGVQALHGPARDAIGRSREQLESEIPTYYFPPARAVRAASLGQYPTVADLYFLRLVQYAGTEAADRAGWPQMLELGDFITDLDPRFGYAYEASGLLLIAKGRFEESTRILDKGVEALPQRWQLQFYAAYNYWYELDRPDEGARLLLLAAQNPNAPEHVSELAARLYDRTGQLEFAYAHLDSIARSTSDEKARARILARRDQVVAEVSLRRIEAAIDEYRRVTGAPPMALADLVRAGHLTELPLGPDGEPFAWDPATATVSWPKMPRRVRYNADHVGERLKKSRR